MTRHPCYKTQDEIDRYYAEKRYLVTDEERQAMRDVAAQHLADNPQTAADYERVDAIVVEATAKVLRLPTSALPNIAVFEEAAPDDEVPDLVTRDELRKHPTKLPAVLPPMSAEVVAILEDIKGKEALRKAARAAPKTRTKAAVR